MSIKNSDHYFLKGGGEMGELIRAKDWSKTPLGDPADWPQSLCTMVAVMLDNPFGMYIAWGSEYIQLYNDGYRPILGATKHPQALGISTRDTFSEIWHIIESMFDEVMKGKGVGFPDFMLPLNRYGYEEECYFDFSYSPIRKDNGEVGGVLVTVIETTNKKKAEERLKESNHRFRNTMKQAPVGITILRGPEYIVEMANDAYLKLVDKEESDFVGKPLFDSLPEVEESVHHLLDNVLNTGIPFHGNEVPIPLNRYGKQDVFYFDFLYHPLKEEDGKISGVIVSVTEVTEKVETRKKIEESDDKLRSLINNAPFPIGVYTGKELRIEVANESIIKAWGKGNDVIGKKFNELMRELEGQKIFEQLEDVFTSGIPFHAYNRHLTLIVDGKEQPYYYNYSFTPLFDLSGKVYGVMNTASDVTDLNLAKKRVEESEQDLRSMALQAPIGICILDASTLVGEIVNDTFIEIAGKPREAIIGKYYWDTFAEARHYYESALSKVVNEGIPFYASEVELMLVRSGKEEIMIVTFVYAPLKDEEGNVKKVAVWVLDNTQQVNARRKIEEGTEKLNIVIEASELGTWELNLKTMTPTYSQKYLEIIGGYKTDIQLTHEQLLHHLHPDDMQIREKAFKDALDSGILHYEARLIWVDKSIHWMEGKGKVFYDANHNPEKMIGTIRDITAERKHQQELEESEQRFRNLIMQSPVAKAILKGKDHVVEMANDALLKDIWRKTEGEVIGKKILEVFPELKKQKYSRLLDEVYSTGIKHTEKESLISFNGNDEVRNLYVDFEYAPVFEAENKISGIKITAIEVTEKVEVRKRIEESEKRFRSLAESLPQLVWETDDKGNMLYASNRWEEYSGIKPGGEPEWKSIIHPDDFETNAKIWTHSLLTGDLYNCDVRIKSKSGPYRWHRAVGEPVFDKENKIVKWVGAFTDIHTEKAFTQELEKQVVERTKELEASNIELEKMNKELQSFAYVSSHDLQEPLRKIQTFATRIAEKEAINLSANGLDMFNRMQNAAKRMQTLIQDLLAYSRTSTTERELETVDLNEIIAEVRIDFKEELKEKNATIEANKLCYADIIPFQFRQLMHNLIGNSLKFSNPTQPPHIKIKSEIVNGINLKNEKLSPDKKYCHISVSDNGIGFEPQFNQKIFEVFQRLHGKSEYNGTGIGLSIVKKIVENHNGIITAKGEPNNGATFDIYIPAS